MRNYKKKEKKHLWGVFITVLGTSVLSNLGLQEKMVIEGWPPAMLSPVYLARRKWEKRERAERTRPTRPTHLSFDLKTIFPINRKAEIKGRNPKREGNKGKKEAKEAELQ